MSLGGVAGKGYEHARPGLFLAQSGLFFGVVGASTLTTFAPLQMQARPMISAAAVARAFCACQAATEGEYTPPTLATVTRLASVVRATSHARTPAARPCAATPARRLHACGRVHPLRCYAMEPRTMARIRNRAAIRAATKRCRLLGMGFRSASLGASRRRWR